MIPTLRLLFSTDGRQSHAVVKRPNEVDDYCVPPLVPDRLILEDPILNNTSSLSAVLPVYCLPDVDEIGSEMGHFLLPGIQYSSRLTRVRHSPFLQDDTKIASSWVVEMGELGRKHWCKNITDLAKRTIQEYKINMSAQNGTTNTMPGWNIHIFDWDDWGGLVFCKSIVRVVPRHNVYYHKRSMVHGRAVDHESKHIILGHVATYKKWKRYSGHPVQHFPYAVRPDMIRLIGEIITKDNLFANKTLPTESCGNVDPSLLERPLDVAHFWEDSVDENARLRNGVNKVLREIMYHKNISAHAGKVGLLGDEGRLSASYDYAKAMLQYKIVVVCQRDWHEDNYRLFEALTSGAMVMADVMLLLPEGLRDEESVVLYSSLNELKQKILYYLDDENRDSRIKIAREGRRVAFDRHLPWIRMKDVILRAEDPREILLEN